MNYQNLNKKERFVMKLNIWQEGQDDIQEKLREYPSLQKYYDMVAKELGCKVEEITCLDVHPDNERSDEEGWQVRSFFPRGIDPQTEIIDYDYHTSDFSIGGVIRLKQDGVVFVAETNASPWTVYANPNNIEAWSK